MAKEEACDNLHLESFEDAFHKVKAQVKVDLPTCAVKLQRLLMAVDLFPLGGLYRGHYADQAIRRYWLLWLPLLYKQQLEGNIASALVPPLDVQWAWFVHRLNPEKYVRDCIARFGCVVHAAHIDQALGFSSGCSSHSDRGPSQPPQQQQQQPQQRQQEQQPEEGTGTEAAGCRSVTRQVWEAAYPAGPGMPPEHVFWPPAPPVPPSTATAKCRQQQQHQGKPRHMSNNCQHPDKCRQHPQHPHQQPPDTGECAGAASSTKSSNAAATPCANCPPPPSPLTAGAGAAADGAAASSNPPDAAAGGSNGQDSSGGSGDEGGGAPAGAGEAAGSSPAADGTLESVCSYVTEGLARQGRFLHQMLRYFYQDPGFLEAGRVRYLRFLALIRTQEPGACILNPMYDQDVMWHSHLAVSFAYVPDCEAVMPADKQPLGHDDTISAESLVDSFMFTLGRYEELTGLMVNPSPTRRLPTFIAQPLAAQLWPLAAALADPRVAPLPPPRKLASELRTGGMQQLQQYEPPRGQHTHASKQRKDGPCAQCEHCRKPNPSPNPTPSRSGVFAGTPDSTSTSGSGRPPMLGSPDHLGRCGAFAIYALWCLAERLQLGPEGTAEASASATPGNTGPGGRPACGGGSRSSCSPGGGDGGGGAGPARRGGSARLFGGCLGGGGGADDDGVSAEGPDGRLGGRRVGGAKLAEAVTYMTRQLLRLSDLTDPASPLISDLHPFWAAATPLPPPQPPLDSAPSQGQRPPAHTSCASSASSCSDPSGATAAGGGGAAAVAAAAGTAPCCSGGDGKGQRRRQRHPDVAPSIDLPSSFVPAAQRAAEPAYLAPHHYAVRGQVYYTPSDFCLLGAGRWCLPGPLAAEIAEREAAEAGASTGLVYDKGSADITTAKGNGPAGGRRSGGRGRGGWWGCRSGRDRSDGSDDDEALRGPQLYGNTLGDIVYSSQWTSLMADCYGRIYTELQRRGPGR